MTFIQRKADAWQFEGGIRRCVEVRYLLRGKQEIVFAVGAYDRSRPLIIDPLIDYVTDFGSTATSEFYLGTVPYAIAADASGDAYIAGDDASGQFPVTTGAATPASGSTGFSRQIERGRNQAHLCNVPEPARRGGHRRRCAGQRLRGRPGLHRQADARRFGLRLQSFLSHGV